MASPICGPVCQHPGCWKARTSRNIGSLSTDIPNYFIKNHPVDEVPTLKVRYDKLQIFLGMSFLLHVRFISIYSDYKSFVS